MNDADQSCDPLNEINDRQEVPRLLHTVTRARIRGKEGNIMKPFGTISTTALFLLLGLAVPAHARQEKQEEKASPPRQEQQAKPEKQEQAKPEKQEQAKPQKQEQAKPQKQEQAKPEKQAQAKPQQQQKQQQQAAKSEKQQEQKTQQQEVKSEKQQEQKSQQQAKGQQKQQQQEAKSEKQQQQKTQQQAKGQQEQQQKQQQQQAKSNKQQQQQQTASSHGGPQRTQKAMAAQRAQPALRLSARGSGRIPDEQFRSHFGREHHFHMGNPVMVGGYSRFQYGGFWFGFVEPWPDGWYYTDEFYIDYVDGGYYMYNPYYPGARFAITVVL